MKKITILAVSSLILIPLASYAVNIPNPLIDSDFQKLLGRVIDLIFTAGLAIAPIAVIIAGILFMTAQGEPGKIQKAQEIIKWTFIGLIILVCSKALVELIKTTIGVR